MESISQITLGNKKNKFLCVLSLFGFEGQIIEERKKTEKLLTHTWSYG